MRKEGVAFLILAIRAGALVAFRPGAQRPQARLAPPARATASATSSAAAAAATAGCSRLPPTGSPVSRARGLWGASIVAASRRRRGGGCALGATVASWPAVEGTDSSSGGGGGGGAKRKRDAAAAGAVAAGGGGVVLIEQEGPAWTEIVWDELELHAVSTWR